MIDTSVRASTFEPRQTSIWHEPSSSTLISRPSVVPQEWTSGMVIADDRGNELNCPAVTSSVRVEMVVSRGSAERTRASKQLRSKRADATPPRMRLWRWFGGPDCSRKLLQLYQLTVQLYWQRGPRCDGRMQNPQKTVSLQRIRIVEFIALKDKIPRSCLHGETWSPSSMSRLPWAMKSRKSPE